MKILPAALCLFLLLSPHAFAKENICNSPSNSSQGEFARYEGTSISIGGEFAVFTYYIGSDGSSDILGDRLESMKFCQVKSKYICIHDAFWYNFAVPRHHLKVGDRWKFAGQDYEVIPSYKTFGGERVPGSGSVNWMFRVLNSQLQVAVIQEFVKDKKSECRNLYYFSESQGLLGVGGVCEQSGQAFSWNGWLVAGDGLGSQKFDRCIPQSSLLTDKEMHALLDQ